MASPSASPQRPQRERRGLAAPELMELLSPTLRVGVWSGVAGAFAGVGAGIARDRSLPVSGVLTGINWFTIGSSYAFTRTIISKSYGGEDKMTSAGKIALSALSGSVAGSIAGLLRRPSQILPSILLMGGFGAGGQWIANSWAQRRPAPRSSSDGWLSSKWSPLRKLSDEEYEHMLSEKLLAVEADIILIDEKITELRLAESKVLEDEKVSEDSKRAP